MSKIKARYTHSIPQTRENLKRKLHHKNYDDIYTTKKTPQLSTTQT
jgi:hypothetical protein